MKIQGAAVVDLNAVGGIGEAGRLIEGLVLLLTQGFGRVA